MTLKINQAPLTRALRGLTLATVGALLISGCSSSGPEKTPLPETTLSGSLVSSINSAVETAMQLSDSSEAVVGIWSAKGDYVSAYTMGSDSDINGDALFRGAQTLQPMMCALVLDQVAKGQITLDRELSRDIPRQTGIGNLTYRQVCDGTSGLPDFKQKYENIYLENPSRSWASGELISEALIQPQLSWPGLDVHRSDSDAVLLGRALSVLAQGDLEELLYEGIFTPANMANTKIPNRNELEIKQANSLSGIGYLPGPNCEAGLVDFNEVSVSILGNSGNSVTTVTDIKNFYENLFKGTFGGEAGLQTLTDVKPMVNPKRDENGDPVAAEEGAETPENTSFRGFGIQKEGPLWGYDGALPGSATAAWHNPESNFTVVVALNNSTAGASFASNLAFQLASVAGESGLPWNLEEMTEKLAAQEVCKPEIVEEDAGATDSAE